MSGQEAPLDRIRRRRLRIGRAVPLVLLAAGLVTALATGWHRALSLESLVARRAELDAFVNAHFAAALLAYVGLYIAAVALSVPGAVWLTIAGGVLFGWLVGGLAAALGATVGATVIFVVVRHALHDFVQRRLGPRLAAIVRGFQADAFSYLLFLRLVPVFPFFLVNVAPALAGVRLLTFVAATAIGILPATLAFAVFGAGLDSVLSGQQAAFQACLAAGRDDCRLQFEIAAALTPQLFAALCALGLAALVPVFLKRRRRPSAPTS
ncbi:MAG: TVP38/TMEM64 family protein [Variibacter sp.]|nr:TVP38/TMEM64 family protein [Variibacter sp.]